MTYLIRFFLCGIFSSFLFPPFFLYPLGFLAFPLLFFFIIEKKHRKFQQFINGFFYGFGLCLVVLYWIREPFYFNASTSNYAYLALLLNLYVSLYFGFAFLFIGFFKSNFSKFIIIPVVFVLAEIIRENFLFGFPWITFALVGSGNHYFLQLPYYIGTNGLSYLILLFYLTPVSILFFNNKETNYYHKINLIITTFSFCLALFLILTRLFTYDVKKLDNEINFSLNQLNVSQKEKVDNLSNKNNIKEIVKILEKQKNSINIFSETDYTDIIKNNNIVSVFQEKLINNNSIIIGGVRKADGQYFNSMYYISEKQFQFFDKIKLVPFGEFLPFRKKLKFLEPIAGKTDFEKGSQNRLITTNYKFNFIPVICYEIIFFNDVLSKFNNESPLLINITNDAWFGKHMGPYQHFYLSRIRSTEYNKYLIRVSNNGVSGIIDNYGKIIEYIPLNLKETRKINIKIPHKLNNIFIFHQIIYIFFIIIIFIAIRIEKRSRNI